MTTALGYVVLGRTGPGERWAVADDPELIDTLDVAEVVLAREVESAADEDDPIYGWEHRIALVVDPERWAQVERIATAHLACRKARSELYEQVEQPKVNKPEQDRLIAAMQAAEADMTAAVDVIDPARCAVAEPKELDIDIDIAHGRITISCPGGITPAALDRIIPALARIRADLTRPRDSRGDQ